MDQPGSRDLHGGKSDARRRNRRLVPAFRWVRAVQSLHHGSASGKGTVGDRANVCGRTGCSSTHEEESGKSESSVGEKALVPIRDLKSNPEMRKVRHGFHAWRVICKRVKRMTQPVNQEIKRRKNTVVKVLFSNIIPNMFNRIEFRRIWWLFDQANIWRQLQGFLQDAILPGQRGRTMK